MKRIALATAAKLPTLNDDDRLLIPARAELGVAAVPAVWDAPDVCWDECHAVLVRSCWDYHHRLEEFLAWVTRLERADVPLWNPPAVLRWNSHKSYLRDLAARGVPIVPTRWLARGRRVGLARLLRDEGWSDAVLKPAVSASATDTWRTSAATAGADQSRLEGAGIPLWNPPAVLRWNSHKGYLRDLAARGVPVVPTRWLGRGKPVDLATLLEDTGWRDAVVKPAVSASASGTWRTSTEAAAGDQARLGELLRAGDVMVQPFVSEVRDRGEWSILFLGGQLSHAVLKRPAEGDYRVQWEFGGSAVTMAPPPRLVADAEAVMAAVPGDAVYARVDGVERDGRLVLMELELIEPHLFLGWDAGAATRLAASIGALVTRP